MRPVKIVLGVIVAGALVIGGMLGRGALRQGPFAGAIEGYMAAGAYDDALTTPTLAGKVAVVDANKRRLDDIHFALPDSVRAATPQEVRTVVLVDRQGMTSGHYQNGAAGKTQTCRVRIVDLEKKRVIVREQFEGEAPGLARASQSEVTGSSCDTDVERYVLGLPHS